MTVACISADVEIATYLYVCVVFFLCTALIHATFMDDQLARTATLLNFRMTFAPPREFTCPANYT